MCSQKVYMYIVKVNAHNEPVLNRFMHCTGSYLNMYHAQFYLHTQVDHQRDVSINQVPMAFTSTAMMSLAMLILSGGR